MLSDSKVIIYTSDHSCCLFLDLFPYSHILTHSSSEFKTRTAHSNQDVNISQILSCSLYFSIVVSTVALYVAFYFVSTVSRSFVLFLFHNNSHQFLICLFDYCWALPNVWKETPTMTSRLLSWITAISFEPIAELFIPHALHFSTLNFTSHFITVEILQHPLKKGVSLK